MSMNWREIALILSELPLTGSIIQKTHQIGFHGLLMELFNKEQGRWYFYIEIGSLDSRMHAVTDTLNEIKPKKTVKLQRFIQFLRAHVEQASITGVVQSQYDRLVTLELDRYGKQLCMIIRLFSGSQANIFVTDENNTIMDLMYRRPNRNEMSSTQFVYPELSAQKDFEIRSYPDDSSFNRFIELTYRRRSEQSIESLLETINNMRDIELAEIDSIEKSILTRLKQLEHYESYKKTADLLSASRHLLQSDTEWATVIDYTQPDTNTVSIAMDRSLSPAQNIEEYYRKYHKAKGAYEHLSAEYQQIVERRRQITSRFDDILDHPNDDSSIDRLKAFISGKDESSLQPIKDPYAKAPGLRFFSNQFTILVGRNSKENDELLRSWVKGNDWWMHTRDVPGPYVFIKSYAQKSIPLETLLDAAHVALWYSKAKQSGKADLYYTQVKYLRRAKGVKKGTVIPTQEKNFFVTLDEKRIERIFSSNGQQ